MECSVEGDKGVQRLRSGWAWEGLFCTSGGTNREVEERGWWAF